MNRRWTVWAVATCGLSLLVAAAAQVPCLAAGPHGQARRGCYSDIWSLYRLRGLRTHTFPYLHVGAFDFPKGTLEYPTLTGVFAWLCALPTSHPFSFFLITATVLAAVALATAARLGRQVGPAALWFTLSPALAAHAFQNWDLLAVGALVAGVTSWWGGRRTWAAVWFAVGACFKIFPGFFLLALLAESLHRKDRRAVGRQLGAAIVVAAGTNLPFLVVAPHAWWQVWTFQQQRPIDVSALSVWTLFAEHIDIPIANFGALVTGLIGLLVVVYLAAQRAERDGRYPTLQAGAAMVVVFVVTQKACSPQDLLWIAPAFAVLHVRARWFVATALVDVATTIAIDWVLYEHPEVQATTQSLPVTVAVVLRAAVLIALVPAFVGAGDRRPVRPPEPEAPPVTPARPAVASG